MKRRLLTLLLTLMGVATTWAATNYGVYVGGKQLTSSNYSSITSSNFPAVTSGTVTYVPSSNELRLSWAWINVSDSNEGLRFASNSAGFTLRLADGTINVVTVNGSYAGLRTSVPLTITGGGTLVVISRSGYGIDANYTSSADYTLSIENSTVMALAGPRGIRGGSNGISGTLNIENSTVLAKGSQASVGGWKALTLTGTELRLPDNAVWDDVTHTVYGADGSVATSMVVFGPASGNVNGDVNKNGTLSIADLTTLADLLLNNTDVPVSGINLLPRSTTLILGATRQMKATPLPSDASNKNVSWSSSDTSVATVSSTGLVMGVNPGTCTITCMAQDGSGVSATSDVTVRQTVPVTGITLSATSQNLTPSSTYQLTATPSPSEADNKNVSWSSSDASVATVSSSGLVTAVNPGTCIITCTARDGSGVSATCNVTVIPPLVTSIALSATSISIFNGTTQQLTATPLPSDANNKNVSWSSSNTSVATVSSTGLVTAVNKGTCTITCTALDGSGVSATCDVTVKQHVTGLIPSFTSISIANGATQQLTAAVSPLNADDRSVNWSSSNILVATVSSTGLVTGVNEGTCTIICTAADGSGVSATCAVTVYYEPPAEIGTHEYVDLNLPSGTLWATTNIGAENPEDDGDYFAWGEITGYNDGKTNFSWGTYKWCKGTNNTITKYCDMSSYGYNGFTDTLTGLEPRDDAAYMRWGTNWRMPTQTQCEELRNNTTVESATINGKPVLKVKSIRSSNFIYLPLTGFRDGTSITYNGNSGDYWSRSLNVGWGSDGAQIFVVYSTFINTNSFGNRNHGMAIRPVRNQ